jgi:SPX domain protein involved in polyphosphate accumulation
MDYYSQISSDGYYKINSLYLDTDQLTLYKNKVADLHKRFSLRIRSYGDLPKPPYYFEIKQKDRDFVKKMRAKVMTDDWPQFFESSEHFDQLDQESKKNLLRFVDLAHTFGARPLVMTQYRRMAFLSTVDNYARVTFDKELKYHPETDYTTKPDETRMCSYDDPECYGDPFRNIVLELKCEQKIPMWFIDLIRTFRLERCGFSKYGNVIETEYAQEESDLISLVPGTRFFGR